MTKNKLANLYAAIIRDLPIETYHEQTEFSSHSRLRDFAESGPRWYYERHVARTAERDESEAMRFGQALETLFQRGGEAFARECAVRPKALGDGRTNASKQWAASNPGKIHLSEADYESMLVMCEALRECKPGMLLASQCEQQLTLRGEIGGAKMQSRPDYVHLDADGPYIIDLKTTKDMSDLLDGPSVWKLGYHTQAAIARQLLAQNGYPGAECYLLVAEKNRGMRTQLVKLKDDLLGWGDEWVHMHATMLAQCINASSWPRASETIAEVGRPGWAKPQN